MPPGLQYTIGAMRLSEPLLDFHATDHDPEVSGSPYHHFIVRVRDFVASIFVGGAISHSLLADEYGIDHREIRGGGFCYRERTDRHLVLGMHSGDFGSIPEDVARAFAELIAERLRLRGIEIPGVRATPIRSELNAFWKTNTVG